MKNLTIIQRPRLFDVLEDFIILWSKETVKYINTIKEKIKKNVTLLDSKESLTSNLTKKPFKTLNMLNFKIGELELSINQYQSDIDEYLYDFNNNDNYDATYCNKRNKALRSCQSKQYKLNKFLTQYKNARVLYDQ